MAEKLQEYSLTWEVTNEMTAKRIGSAGSQILSTPNMVALMEAAALELAKSYLEEGQTTVGAEIHCRHLAPTPVGMKVTATAKLRSIERRKMWFDIEVNDEKGKCGQGCEQGGIRSIRFKYHARILLFWNKGERQNQFVVCHACE